MNITLCLLHSITGSDLVLAVGVSKVHTTKHPRLHIHQAEHRISTISTEALHFLLVSQENRTEVSQSHVIVQWKKQSIFSGLRKKKFIETASVFWTFFLGAGGYTRCTTYTGKGIGFEREHTHEETLIYFSLRARDVLLIDHQSGRLLPIHNQGKLMSTCRAKCCLFCFCYCTDSLDVCSSQSSEGDFNGLPEGGNKWENVMELKERKGQRCGRGREMQGSLWIAKNK